MINDILNLDKQLFLFLNSLHIDFLDQLMLFVSNSFFPILVILFIFFSYGYKFYRKSIFLLFIPLLISFGLSDSISSRILKPSTKRLRPCHEKTLKVYTANNGCGGKYSFVSSHASNSFAILFFMFLLFKRFNRYSYLFLMYAGVVSYSRIYLSRHYPLDIFCGAILGLMITYIVYWLIDKKTNLLKSQ